MGTGGWGPARRLRQRCGGLGSSITRGGGNRGALLGGAGCGAGAGQGHLWLLVGQMATAALGRGGATRAARPASKLLQSCGICRGSKTEGSAAGAQRGPPPSISSSGDEPVGEEVQAGSMGEWITPVSWSASETSRRGAEARGQQWGQRGWEDTATGDGEEPRPESSSAQLPPGGQAEEPRARATQLRHRGGGRVGGAGGGPQARTLDAGSGAGPVCWQGIAQTARETSGGDNQKGQWAVASGTPTAPGGTPPRTSR